MGEDGTRVILVWQKVGQGSKTGICRLINGGRAPDPVCGVGLATKDRLEAGPSTCQRSVCMNSPTRIRRILLVSPMQPSTAPGTRNVRVGSREGPRKKQVISSREKVTSGSIEGGFGSVGQHWWCIGCGCWRSRLWKTAGEGRETAGKGGGRLVARCHAHGRRRCPLAGGHRARTSRWSRWAVSPGLNPACQLANA